MSWTKLTEFEQDFLPRGTLLKFPAKYPFEGQVVMMVCEGPEREVDRQCLLTITGSKAGINPYVVFPASPVGYLQRSWLIENWNKWVWPNGDVSDALVRGPLDASEL
jgi:hypothetical protein